MHPKIGRRSRQVPAEVGRYVLVVVAGDRAVTVLCQVRLGQGDRLREGPTNPAIGEGWGFQAAVVEEEVGLAVGDTP